MSYVSRLVGTLLNKVELLLLIKIRTRHLVRDLYVAYIIVLMKLLLYSKSIDEANIFYDLLRLNAIQIMTSLLLLLLVLNEESIHHNTSLGTS